METGVIPSDVELAERLGVSADKLRLVLTSSKRTYSSSAPLKMRRRRGAGSIVESDLSFEDTWASQQGAPIASPHQRSNTRASDLLFV